MNLHVPYADLTAERDQRALEESLLEAEIRGLALLELRETARTTQASSNDADEALYAAILI